MPRRARFKVAAVAELFRQLEYAPPETRLRQMDATERLIADIDQAQNYPEDFIVYRITGYRRDDAGDSMTLVGEALLPDLVNFVLLLSRDLRLAANHAGRRAIALGEVAARLDVSAKTVQRYRRQGLVCHYILSSDGGEHVACFEDSLQRFQQSHQRQIEKAGTFTRMNGSVEEMIVRQAGDLRQKHRLSLNEAAKRLALEHRRAHETIRQLLRRHDRRARQPIFQQRGPLTERMIRMIHRAWLFGIAPERIARRYGKSKPTIHRAINRRRAELLRQLRIPLVKLPTFDLPDAAEIILSAPHASSELDKGFVDDTEVKAFIENARKAATPANDPTEDALLAAYNLLKMEAQRGVAQLGHFPGSEELDEIETALRWAAMLKRVLVVRGLPASMRRIEHHINGALTAQLPENLAQAMRLAVKIVARAVDALDPSRGQRMDRVVGLAMDRALAREPLAQIDRGVLRNEPSSLRLSDFVREASPWVWLSVPPPWRHRLPALNDDRARQVICLRHGWNGAHPHTIREIAKSMRMTPIGVVRLLRAAEVQLRRLNSTT